MFQLVSLFIFCLFSTQIWAAREFTKNDLVGPESICAQEKDLKLCDTNDGQLNQSANDLDDYLAMTELRRNIEAMAGAQVQNSMQLLQIMGMQKPGMILDRQLMNLKSNGIISEIRPSPPQPELLQKYIVAAKRYHELKTLFAAHRFEGIEKAQIQKKLKLLELRFPLLSNYHFKIYKDSVCSEIGINCKPQIESAEEGTTLDQFLFQDQPADLKLLKFNNPTSYTAKIATYLSAHNNPQINENLLSELQASLSSQIAPLQNLKSLEECNLLNLHSKLSLQVINSSANPERMFGKYCDCQKTERIIDDNLVMGLEMASLGGLGLCLTPTGVTQVLGCPTAAIAGLGATGANAINFFDSANKFQIINDQKNIVQFLDRTNLNKEEEEFLKNKELQSIKDAGVSGLVGLIGFGVGNIGIKGLIKYFHKGNVSKSMKEMTEAENAILNKAMDELELKDQTKAFVLLEKLDKESRDILIKHPTLIVKEIKKGGKSCDL